MAEPFVWWNLTLPRYAANGIGLCPGGQEGVFHSNRQVDDLIGRGIRARAGQPGIPFDQRGR